MNKFCKFCENRLRDTPLRGVYIPKFGKILVTFSVFGVLHLYTLIVAPTGVKFGMKEWIKGPLFHAKFHPNGVTCRRCGAKNLKSPSE